MGNLRSTYRSIERFHLESKGKAVRCQRIGRVSYPRVKSEYKFKMTRYIGQMLAAMFRDK